MNQKCSIQLGELTPNSHWHTEVNSEQQTHQQFRFSFKSTLGVVCTLEYIKQLLVMNKHVKINLFLEEELMS